MSGDGTRGDGTNGPGGTRGGPAEAGGQGGDPGRAPAPHQPPPTRLVGTLGGLAAVAGLAIVLVFQWAQPRIEEHRARELEQAIREVLGEPSRYATRWVVDGTLHDSLPAGADSSAAERLYAGYGEDGRLLGYAVTGEKPGYQDVVRLIFGYDPYGDRLLGMKVLENKETPGLGAKIATDSAFVSEFEGAEPPLVGVKEAPDDPGEIDMITGATISSEAVIDIINARLEDLARALEPESGVARSGDAAGAAASSGAERDGGGGPGRSAGGGRP